MALVSVFIDVLEVRIERIVIEIEIGVGVRGALPCLGDSEIFSVDHLWLGKVLAFSILRSNGNGEGPVIAVVADGADDLFLGNDIQHAGQVADKPGLAGNGAGIAGGLVLVVVHQDDAVGVFGDCFEIGIGSCNSGVDEEMYVQRMQVAVQLTDEGQVGRSGVVGQAFKIE